jgi:hypothetical protein
MFPLLLLALVFAPATVVAQPAAALTAEQQLAFLRSAEVTASRPIGKGVTGSMRLTLSDGALAHDAAFQSIEDRATPQDLARGRRRAGELHFADSYKFNIAAYELARLLGLGHMMPATVERRWKGQVGSLTWWVDDVLMDEAEREKTNTQPPSVLAFQRQRQTMFVFAELLHDTDRNKGNVVYTKDWRVIMIDFTRAFRIERRLRSPNLLQQCDRELLARLKALTEDEVRKATSGYLTGNEVAGVMARRRLIVERYESLVKQRGESVVLY